MNRLSLLLLLTAGLTTLCGTTFSERTSTTIASPSSPASHRLKMETLPRPNQTLYYWYSYPYDTYNDRKTVADEINEMWLYYAALVDTDPSGGVLIEKGYYTGAYPHNQLPSYFLYVHWVY
jgi:hypothetical protein